MSAPNTTAQLGACWGAPFVSVALRQILIAPWLCSAIVLGSCGTTGCSGKVDTAANFDAGGRGGGPGDSSAGAPATSPPAICNGSSAVVLRAYIEPDLSRELPGSSVRVENGFPSIVIDGKCKYWLNGGWLEDSLARDLGWRAGVLSAQVAATLESVIDVDHLSDSNDCTYSAGMSDYSIMTIRSLKSSASCRGTAGSKFSADWKVLQDSAVTLWEQAIPLDQGIHVAAVSASSAAPGGPVPYAWPTGIDLGSLILDPQQASLNSTGLSQLVELPDATQLRQLRDQYLGDVKAEPGAYVNWDGLEVTDGTRVAVVFMRDALPYEDPKGLLPLSPGQP